MIKSEEMDLKFLEQKDMRLFSYLSLQKPNNPMNSLLRVLFFIALYCLSGCATQEKTALNSQTLNQCKMICVQHLEFCQKNCKNNCPTCSSDSNYSSRLNYCKYVHEEQVQGGYITRGLNSYRDPLQCLKVSCNCPSDFITCNQYCTSVIQKD
jgi:hypothetical protein